MSYNITGIRVRQLELTIPVDFQFQKWIKQYEDEDFYEYLYVRDIDLMMTNNGRWEIEGSESSISGRYDYNGFYVEKLEIQEEGSYGWYGMFKAMLADFGGKFEAVVVWEGGDSIQLVAIDGANVVEEEL